MLPIFLSDKDINCLTGRLRPSAQCRWLQHNGWKYTVNQLGRPVVAFAEAERKLVGTSTNQSSSKEPNWESLDGS